MNREWYFVRKLEESDRLEAGEAFEVQVLNDVGQAIATGYLSAASEHLVVDGREIPRLVIEAAKQRQVGYGEYVGPDGKVLPAF